MVTCARVRLKTERGFVSKSQALIILGTCLSVSVSVVLLGQWAQERSPTPINAGYLYFGGVYSPPPYVLDATPSGHLSLNGVIGNFPELPSETSSGYVKNPTLDPALAVHRSIRESIKQTVAAHLSNLPRAGRKVDAYLQSEPRVASYYTQSEPGYLAVGIELEPVEGVGLPPFVMVYTPDSKFGFEASAAHDPLPQAIDELSTQLADGHVVHWRGNRYGLSAWSSQGLGDPAEIHARIQRDITSANGDRRLLESTLADWLPSGVAESIAHSN